MRERGAACDEQWACKREEEGNERVRIGSTSQQKQQEDREGKKEDREAHLTVGAATRVATVALALAVAVVGRRVGKLVDPAGLGLGLLRSAAKVGSTVGTEAETGAAGQGLPRQGAHVTPLTEEAGAESLHVAGQAATPNGARQRPMDRRVQPTKPPEAVAELGHAGSGKHTTPVVEVAAVTILKSPRRGQVVTPGWPWHPPKGMGMKRAGHHEPEPVDVLLLPLPWLAGLRAALEGAAERREGRRDAGKPTGRGVGRLVGRLVGALDRRQAHTMARTVPTARLAVCMPRMQRVRGPMGPTQRPFLSCQRLGHAVHRIQLAARGSTRRVGRAVRLPLLPLLGLVVARVVGVRDRAIGGVAQMTPCVAVPSTLVSQPAGHVKLPTGARQRYPPGSERGLRPRRRTQRPGQPVLVMRRLSAHVAPCSGVAGCVAFQPGGQLTTPAGATQRRLCPS